MWRLARDHRGLIVPALLLPLAAFLAVSLAQLVPDEVIVDRLQQSIQRGELRDRDHETTTLGNEIGKVGDCIVLFLGLGDDDAMPIWHRALRSYTMGSCEQGVPAIEGHVRGRTLTATWDYFRYWHGNSVFLRPAVALFGVAAARHIAGAFIMAGLLLLVLVTTRGVSATVGLALVTPLVVTSEWWDLPESFSQALSVATLLLCTTASFVAVERKPTMPRLVTAAATAGAIYAFVDLLSIPPGAAVLTATVVTIARQLRSPGQGNWFATFVRAAGAWFAGYGWMWATKWLLAAVALGPADVFEYIGRRALIRINGADPRFVPGLGNALSLNVERWLERPFSLTVVAVTVGLVVHALLVSRRLRLSVVLTATVPLAFLAVWYEVLSNHSQLHSFFTQRSIPVMLGCIQALVLSMRRAERNSAVTP